MGNLVPQNAGDLAGLSYQEAIGQQREQHWQDLAQVQVGQALEFWLRQLKPHTLRSYKTAFAMLAQKGMVEFKLSLQQFALLNHERVIDEVKALPVWSEATKQARAAAYISFTAFLQRRTQGLVRKALANREGSLQTFFKVRDKVKTNPLTELQTKEFFLALAKINPRDALIAKLLLQGGKRKGEVLALKREEIDFAQNRIRFGQSKTKGVIKETIITYPPALMQELNNYLGERPGLCFVTKQGKPLAPTQLDRNFLLAGRRAGIPFRVTPHCLRVTLVTRLKERQVQDSDILKITGHASPVQLLAYDRSDQANNASARFQFV